MEERKRRLKEEILRGFSYQTHMSDDELSEIIDEKIMESAGEGPVTLKERLKLKKELFDSFRRLDILQELVDDPSVTEIMVNGPGEIFVETGGTIGRWDRSFESREQLLDLIRQTQAERPITWLIVNHQLEQKKELCDVMHRMEKGRYCGITEG